MRKNVLDKELVYPDECYEIVGRCMQVHKYLGRGGFSEIVIKDALQHEFGLEKIELSVYEDNLPAVALYEKFGFVHEGLIRKYRKLEGRYFDAHIMAKFLDK